MLQFHYKDLTVEVYNEYDHTVGSADNVREYEHYYMGDDIGEYSASSQHGVRVLKDGEVVSSCLLAETHGATGVHSNSALLDGDRIVVCCSNYLYCLSIPDLDLIWKIEGDMVTCFQVFALEDDYVIHGELQVTRIGKDGTIKWRIGGRDIFVSLDGHDEFVLKEDHIILTDFIGNVYKLDFNGKSELIKEVR